MTALRYCTPLLAPSLNLKSTLNSKSFVVPPRQMRNVFTVIGFSAVVSPMIAPFSTRQIFGSPSQAIERLAIEDRGKARVVVCCGRARAEVGTWQNAV